MSQEYDHRSKPLLLVNIHKMLMLVSHDSWPQRWHCGETPLRTSFVRKWGHQFLLEDGTHVESVVLSVNSEGLLWICPTKHRVRWLLTNWKPNRFSPAVKRSHFDLGILLQGAPWWKHPLSTLGWSIGLNNGTLLDRKELQNLEMSQTIM